MDRPYVRLTHRHLIAHTAAHQERGTHDVVNAHNYSALDEQTDWCAYSVMVSGIGSYGAIPQLYLQTTCT